MQSHRTAAAPDPGTPEHRMQRLVLLELVVDPPHVPERVDELADRLAEPASAVRAAGAALEAAGLAVQEDDALAAAGAARYFEALWPIAL
jgi:hypothetical protein